MSIPWIALSSKEQITDLVELSKQKPCLIFKHSTRCSISSMAQFRLEDDWDFDQNEITPYYLDLIRYREISNYVAEFFQVYHESPQVLLIKDGECVYDESHMGIRVGELKEAIHYKN